MTEPIDFYFDFSSPFSYLASGRIDDLAAAYGRSVMWRPFLLGPVFQITGAKIFGQVPMKTDYALRDMPRTARLLDIPFTWPDPFPFMSLAAARAFYWLHQREPEQAKSLAKAVFHAAFGEGRNVSEASVVVDLAADLGVDRDQVLTALQDPAVKDRLRSEVDAAVARGVFGAPFIIVDGEPFWGHDRLDQVSQWLRTGGW